MRHIPYNFFPPHVTLNDLVIGPITRKSQMTHQARMAIRNSKVLVVPRHVRARAQSI